MPKILHENLYTVTIFRTIRVKITDETKCLYVKNIFIIVLVWGGEKKEIAIRYAKLQTIC